MTRSAITLASFVLALAAPVLVSAQDTTTPPSTTDPAAPVDAAATPAAVPGDQAVPGDDDPEAQQQQATQTTATSGNESGQGLETDMAAADADQHAESTPVPPLTDDAAAPGEEKLPFRGSIFLWDHSYNMYGLTLPYSNPTYTWYFSLRPRWYFGDDWYVAARFDAYYELTDSDSTTTNHRFDLGDAVLYFGRPKIGEIEHFSFGASASLTLPLSIASRANGLIAATGITGNVTREFEHVMEGLTLTGSLGYSHSFNTGNTLTRDDTAASPVSPGGSALAETSAVFQPDPVRCAIAQQNEDGSPAEGVCSGGASTTSDSVLLTLGGSLAPIKHMTFDLSYTWWWRHARGLADATVIASGMPVTIPDGSLTHWRNLQVFSIGVGYDIVPWLNASLSWYALTTQLNPNGSFRNPFANPDSMLDLTFTVALDELYKVFRPTPQTTEHNPTATASARSARSRQ